MSARDAPSGWIVSHWHSHGTRFLASGAASPKPNGPVTDAAPTANTDIGTKTTRTSRCARGRYCRKRPAQHVRARHVAGALHIRIAMSS